MYRGAGRHQPPYPLRRPAQLGPVRHPRRVVRADHDDHRPVRVRLRADKGRRPRPQYAHDEPYRGNPARFDAQGHAVGLGDVPRIPRQPRSSGPRSQHRLLASLLLASGLCLGDDPRPGTHVGHRPRAQPPEGAVPRGDAGRLVRLRHRPKRGGPLRGRQPDSHPHGFGSGGRGPGRSARRVRRRHDGLDDDPVGKPRRPGANGHEDVEGQRKAPARGLGPERQRPRMVPAMQGGRAPGGAAEDAATDRRPVVPRRVQSLRLHAVLGRSACRLPVRSGGQAPRAWSPGGDEAEPSKRSRTAGPTGTPSGCFRSSTNGTIPTKGSPCGKWR